MKSNCEHFSGIKPFDIKMNYVEITSDSPENVFDSHIHEECEVYINLSGDVSFVVENHIYPVRSGDVIITRPFEYHHCVYHSNKLHKHFCILLSCAGNEALLNVFFNRKPGENNHLSLSPGDTESLINICRKMTEKEPRECEKYYNFFTLMKLLQNADAINFANGNYPPDVVYALHYINTNFAQQITIGDIAKGANVSVNTLERHFTQVLDTSPSAFIRKKRLTNAANFLAKGCSVTEASECSGFSDYSNFIALFKKTYGITPLKYKKNQQKS